MGLNVSLPPPPTTESYRYDEKSNFTGGLNFRADQFNLGETESPEMLNVSVDPRGGVRRRDGIKRINPKAINHSTLYPDGIITGLNVHYESGQNQVLASVYDSVKGTTVMMYNTGADGNFDGTIQSGSADVEFTGDRSPQGVTFNNFTYYTNGSGITAPTNTPAYSVLRWDGTNAVMGIWAYGNGYFPCARYVATWNEMVWAAHLTETTQDDNPNRVRFSKTNDGDDWSENDYIDIDLGEDGDFITGIISDQDRLLVFKQNAVYAIYGFDRDTFEVRNLTRAVGNRDGCQPTAGRQGIFFWYAEKGVYLIQNPDNEPVYVFERIYPAMTYDLGNPALSLDNAPSLMWYDEKLWVSVDYQSAENISESQQANRRNVFMWDPSLGNTGAWVRYDINARAMLSYRPSGEDHSPIAVVSEIEAGAAYKPIRIAKIDQNVDTDDYGASAVNVINSYYQTSWFEGNRPTFLKRWGKTRTVLLSDNSVALSMYAYKDYNLASSSQVQSGAFTGITQATWDSDPTGSGNGIWDTSEWAQEGTTDKYLVVRWGSIGTAKAISLRFASFPAADATGKWGVTSVVGMYRTRRLR